jgi:hypothetical protein
MSLPLTDLVYHVSLTMGPDVRNRVKPAKNANQCTLERIRSKPVVFCNFAEYRWFCVFLAQMWWFLELTRRLVTSLYMMSITTSGFRFEVVPKAFGVWTSYAICITFP